MREGTSAAKAAIDAFAKDRPRLDSIREVTTEGGTEKGKGKEQGKSKGKEDAKGGGKRTKGQKGTKAAQTEDTESAYTSQTSHGENWGIVKDQQKWGGGNYNNNWILYPPEHKWAENCPRKGREDHDDGPSASARISPTVGSVPTGETGDRVKVRGGASLLNFGSYHDWAYGELMTNKPNYVS